MQKNYASVKMAASGIGEQEQEHVPEVRFLHQSADDDGTTCVRCREPFLQSTPWQDFCSHRFCDRCFGHLCTGHFPCPACQRKGEIYTVGSEMHFRDKSYQRMWRNLRAKCSFDPPCGWVGEFIQLQEHESWCVNRKSACFSCGARVLLREMESHVTYECRHRRVICHHCQCQTTYSAIIDYERTECQFYHNALIQHSSRRQHDALKGLRILQKATYKKLDSHCHLSKITNRSLQSNGNKAVGERRDCPQLEEGFLRLRVQLEHLESKLDDLIYRTKAKDNLSVADNLREEIERIDESCAKLKSSGSFKESDVGQGEGCGPKVECFGKEDLEKWKEKKVEAGLLVEEQERSNPIAGERMKLVKMTEKLVDSSSTNVETAEPEKLLEKKEEEQDKVNEEKMRMRISHGEERRGNDCAKEKHCMNIKNEDEDFAKERKALERVNDRNMRNKLKKHVVSTQTTKSGHKTTAIGDVMPESEPERVNEGNQKKMNNEKPVNSKSGNESCLCCWADVTAKGTHQQ